MSSRSSLTSTRGAEKPLRPWLAALLFLAAALATITPASGQAGEGGWTAPVKLFEGDGYISNPAIVTDPTGMVHAFWAYSDVRNADSDEIYHSEWNGHSWSEPTDIVVPPSAVEGLTAAAGPDYSLDLYWSGEWHSRAASNEATSARGWSGARSDTQGKIHGAIAADGQGRIHAVYSSLRDRGVYYHRLGLSEADARAQPTLISTTINGDAAADWVRVAVGPDGTIHVVWTEYRLPKGMPPLGIYYSHSSDGGQAWSAPWQVDGEGNVQPNLAIGPKGEVHIAWNGAAMWEGGRFHRYSVDGGQTFSQRQAIFERGGGSDGPPDMMFDSSGNLHLVTNTAGTCAMHFQWRNGRWFGPDCASPQRFVVDTTAATLSGGNQLHVLFREEAAHQLWYAGRTLGAPAIPPRPLPTAWPTATPKPVIVVVTPQPTRIPANVAAALRIPIEALPGAGDSVQISFTVTALLIALLVGAVVFRHRAGR